MKALFLVKRITTSTGKSKVILIDVNGGDSNNDFRSGSPNGELAVDIYGESNPFEAGKTYLMEIAEYLPTDEAVKENVTVTEVAEQAAETILFEGAAVLKITRSNDELKCMVKMESIAEKEETAEETQQEEQPEQQADVQEPAQEGKADTQDNADTGADTGTDTGGATVDAAAGDKVDDSTVLPDTQAGPGTSPTGGDNTAADNVVDPAKDQAN